MPELPEVETLRRELALALEGKTIKEAKILWPKVVAPLSPATFARQIKDRQIKSVARRAKILLIDLNDSRSLGIHLKMTGQLIYRSAKKLIIGGHPGDPTNHTRAVFTFSDGSQLSFNDLRKFGWLKILNASTLAEINSRHGPEALSAHFRLGYFHQLTRRYPQRRLKQLLLDQALIAGLGNIYADESCHRARLRPTRRAGTLAPAEFGRLHREIKKVLTLAVRHGGTSIRDYRQSDGGRGGFAPYLRVYGRGGEPCKKCRTPIKKIKLAGRGTHYCPQCQS